MEIINQSKLHNMKGKRGQITIFVIISILLVIAIVLIFILYRDSISSVISRGANEPNQNIEQCIDRHIEEASNKIIEIGGYVKTPGLVKEFEGRKIPYLCYTSKEDEKCNSVEPVIIEHINDEIYNEVYDKIDSCFNDLREELQSENYNVVLGSDMEVKIELLPGKVRTSVKRDLKISKSEVNKAYSSYLSSVQTPIYDIFTIVHEITRQESRYCNSDYPLIMRLIKNVQIDKFQTGDDNKIYDVKDLTTSKSTRFAVRSCVLTTPG